MAREEVLTGPGVVPRGWGLLGSSAPLRGQPDISRPGAEASLPLPAPPCPSTAVAAGQGAPTAAGPGPEVTVVTVALMDGGPHSAGWEALGLLTRVPTGGLL